MNFEFELTFNNMEMNSYQTRVSHHEQQREGNIY